MVLAWLGAEIDLRLDARSRPRSETVIVLESMTLSCLVFQGLSDLEGLGKAVTRPGPSFPSGSRPTAAEATSVSAGHAYGLWQTDEARVGTTEPQDHADADLPEEFWADVEYCGCCESQARYSVLRLC